jgi:hypothetical protein
MTDPAALPTFGLSMALGPFPGPLSSAEPGPTPDGGPDAVDAVDVAEVAAGGSGRLRERVVAALLDGGYRPTVDDDGDVEVTVQEQMLFVRCIDSVPPLMRVFGQWLIADLPHSELAQLRAANAVTASVNLAKATVHEDRLTVAVDLLAGDDFHLPSLLDASMDAVLGCVRSWHATVLELTGRPG